MIIHETVVYRVAKLNVLSASGLAEETVIDWGWDGRGPSGLLNITTEEEIPNNPRPGVDKLRRPVNKFRWPDLRAEFFGLIPGDWDVRLTATFDTDNVYFDLNAPS